MLVAGDPAPEFEGTTADGKKLQLGAFRGKTVVLYFYPKAGSPGCTRESKQLASRYAAFQERGIEIIGISVDNEAAQRRFKESCDLPFPLVSDSGKEISRRFGVLGAFGYAKRVTFIIDPAGRVRQVVDSFLPGPHVEESFRLLEGSP